MKKPKAKAKKSVEKKGYKLALLTKDLSDYRTRTMLKYLQQTLSAAGCMLQIVMTEGKEELEEQYLTTFIVQNVNGILIESCSSAEFIMKQLRTTAIPYVFLRSHMEGNDVAMDEVEDVELSDLAKQVTDTSDNIVCIRLIEQFFLRRLYAFSEYNLKRMSAVFQEINLQPQINIPQLSEAACLSSKQFGRVFADHVGTTPKEYLRIVRMQRALFLLQQDVTLPFVQVAYECGYSDQSHMIKEF